MSTLDIFLSDSSCVFQKPSVQKWHSSSFWNMTRDNPPLPSLRWCKSATKAEAVPMIYEASWNTVAGDYAVLHVDIIR